MKQLILLRHAKSSWANPEVEDFDRSLNKRGKRSAKALGAWLRASPYRPDLVLCSAARRTRETWEGLKIEAPFVERADLYEADPEHLIKTLRDVGSDCVMIIGHNPGCALVAHALVAQPPDHPRFDDYPTGSLLITQFDIDGWDQLENGSGKVVDFLTPHDLTESA